MYDFVAVVPTHNEEKFIGSIIKDIGGTVSKRFTNFLIVVADGASTDGTRTIVSKMASKDKHIRLVGYQKLGQRGKDVRDTMAKFSSRLYFYVDADLSPSIRYLPQALKLEGEGNDVVIGSRYLNKSKTVRPPLRRMVSKAYNKVLNVLFDEKVTDHQCGFRIFNKKAFDVIYERSQERHWMWDTEVILIARANHLKMKELPILWIEKHNTRTPLARLVNDIKLHGTGILRMFYRFRISNGS